MRNMQEISEEIRTLAANVRLLAMDVDGVLTDGRIIYTATGDEIKFFNVKDGQGIDLLNKAGIHTAIITARTSPINERRGGELGIRFICQGQKKKLECLQRITQELGITLNEVAYIGDDLPDLRPMLAAALPCCPADAVPEVREIAKYVASVGGGQGAVREITDLILKAQGKYPELPQPDEWKSMSGLEAS